MNDQSLIRAREAVYRAPATRSSHFASRPRPKRSSKDTLVVRWELPIELSPEEARVAALLHRVRKLYVFLRTIRAELFDETF